MKIDTFLIEKAIAAIKDTGIVNQNTGQYEKVFKGYISSFGASIAQAGLIPTIIFFEAESEQAKERPKVIKALKAFLDADYQTDSLALSLVSKRDDLIKEKGYQQGVEAFKLEEKRLLKIITNAMVAIKLALRLYKEKKNEVR